MYKGFKKYFLKYLAGKKVLKSKLFRYEYKLQPRAPKIVSRQGLNALRQHQLNQPSFLEYSVNLKSCVGSYIEDSHGNKILNLDMGSSAPLGYNSVQMRKHQMHGEYDSALFQSFSLSQHPPTNISDILRQQVMPIAPVGHNSIHFSEGNGSLAVQDALRAIFQQTGGKGKILSFKNQTHGDTLSTKNLSENYNWPTVALPKPRLPYLKHQAHNHKQQQLSLKQIKTIFENDHIAGLIVEPVNSSDFYSASPDYYKQLCRICRDHGVKVIVNETQSCMGGAQSLWGHQTWNLEQQQIPDYVVFGGRAQQSGYFCKYEDRSKSFTPSAGGDLKRLIQFITVWKHFFSRKDICLDLGTAMRVELERVRNESDWLVDNIRGSGSQVAFDCDSYSVREAIYKYLLMNGIKVGKAGDRSIVLRPSLQLRAYDVGVFRDMMLNFDSSMVQMIQGNGIFD